MVEAGIGLSAAKKNWKFTKNDWLNASKKLSNSLPICRMDYDFRKNMKILLLEGDG